MSKIYSIASPEVSSSDKPYLELAKYKRDDVVIVSYAGGGSRYALGLVIGPSYTDRVFGVSWVYSVQLLCGERVNAMEKNMHTNLKDALPDYLKDKVD